MILIIDDSPHDFALLVAALEELGAIGPIRVAANLAEALQALAGAGPSVCVCDYYLANATAEEIIPELPRHQLRIIVSSSLLPPSAQAALAGMVDAFVEKPLDLTGYTSLAQRVIALL